MARSAATIISTTLIFNKIKQSSSVASQLLKLSDFTEASTVVIRKMAPPAVLIAEKRSSVILYYS